MQRCTGWWYEGGGVFRNSFLISSSRVRIPSHGVFVASHVPNASGSNFVYPSLPREGITARTATLTVRVHVDIDHGSGIVTNSTMATQVTFTVFNRAGRQVASRTSRPGHLPANISSTLTLEQAQVWSVARPYLYTLTTTVRVGGCVADRVNTSFGIRNVRWSPDEGLMLNEQRVKLRGFCNHENFAGVGSAIPERVNLLR